MATLIWTEPAVADLEEIGEFISKDNPSAAEKWAPGSFGKQKMSLPFPSRPHRSRVRQPANTRDHLSVVSNYL
jgi:plasmid stabilization system protein ParE